MVEVEAGEKVEEDFGVVTVVAVSPVVVVGLIEAVSVVVVAISVVVAEEASFAVAGRSEVEVTVEEDEEGDMESHRHHHQNTEREHMRMSTHHKRHDLLQETLMVNRFQNADPHLRLHKILTGHRHHEIRTLTVNRILTHRHHDDHSTSGNQHLHQLRTLLLRRLTRMAVRHLVPSTSQLPHDHAIPMLLLRIRMQLVHRLPQLEDIRLQEDIQLREVIQRQLHLIPTTKLHMIEHHLPERLRGMPQLQSMLRGDLPPGQAEDLPVDTLRPGLLHEKLLLPGDMLDMNNNVGPHHKLGMGKRKLPATLMVRTAAQELLRRVVLLNTQVHLLTFKDIRCRQRLRLCRILNYSKQKKAAALDTEKHYSLL